MSSPPPAPLLMTATVPRLPVPAIDPSAGTDPVAAQGWSGRCLRRGVGQPREANASELARNVAMPAYRQAMPRSELEQLAPPKLTERP